MVAWRLWLGVTLSRCGSTPEAVGSEESSASSRCGSCSWARWLVSRRAAAYGREDGDTSAGLVWCRLFLSPLRPGRLALGRDRWSWLCVCRAWLLALLLLLHLVRQLLNPLA